MIAAVALGALIAHGLLLYDAYNPQAAFQVFASAAQAYPGDPMPPWGEALALGPNINEPLTQENFERAQPEIARARQLAAGATPEERALIAALAQRYAGSWSDRDEDAARYREAMSDVVARYPTDDRAAMLYAEALADADPGMRWTRTGRPASTALRTMISVVEKVLARDPENVMANHLCIHAYDFAPDHAPAIACATRIDAMTFEPAAEHLQHMPAHTWMETGAYAKALASSERAYALVRQLMADPQADQGHARYATHDAFVGFDASMMLGNLALAQRWADRLAQLGSAPLQGSIFARFGRWSDILALPRSETSEGWRALAEFHLGDVAQARAFARNTSTRDTRDGVTLLRARVAEADGDVNAAAAILRAAIARQAEQYGAETLPFFPMQEALGTLYVRVGDFARARTAYRVALAAYPNDPRALFGLAQAQDRSGMTAQAAATRAQLATVWVGADTTLTVTGLP